MNGLVIVLIICLVALSPTTTAERLIRTATDLLGPATLIQDDMCIWQMDTVKLCITHETQLPVQLYFEWGRSLVRTRTDLYAILSKLCSNVVNYDIGSSKFTIKDVSLIRAIAKMESIRKIE